MKERFKILKKELNKLIIEKRKVFNNKTQIIIDENNFNTKIDTNKKTKKNNNDIFYFLDLKCNILDNTLKKLSILLQNQFNQNNKEDNDYINSIKETKAKIKKELIKEEKNMENNFQNIKLGYNNYIQNYNINNEIINKKENNLDNDNYQTKLGQIINLLDKTKKKEENNLNKIKKELNEKIDKINKEIKNEKMKLNFGNNLQIKKYFDNIKNELDKGKSYEYLKRNEYKEIINSILNDILMKIEIEK